MLLPSSLVSRARPAGWLLAAAVLTIGCVVGVPTRPTPPAPPPDPVSVVEALSDWAAPSPPASVALGAFRAGTPRDRTAAEVEADAFGWPASTPPTSTVRTPASPVPAPVKPTPPPVWWSRYVGTDHVWMPTLGMSRPVYLFPCSRGTAPDNLVYRWGCAGRNNVYLLGHAYGVFRALHDAYYNGKLRVGMPVVYADSRGRVRLYRVVTWRIVNPANATWAIASQRYPSMTLQTCIGPDASLRLNVRLVEVDR